MDSVKNMIEDTEKMTDGLVNEVLDDFRKHFQKEAPRLEVYIRMTALKEIALTYAEAEEKSEKGLQNKLVLESLRKVIKEAIRKVFKVA